MTASARVDMGKYSKSKVREYWKQMVRRTEMHWNTAGELYAIFRIGTVRFALKASYVHAVVLFREPSPLPMLPKHLMGVTSIRGRPVSVTNLSYLTGIEEEPRDKNGYLVLLGDGEEKTALKVDWVFDVALLDPSKSVAPPEKWKGVRNGIVTGMIDEPGAPAVLLLDAVKCIRSVA